MPFDILGGGDAGVATDGGGSASAVLHGANIETLHQDSADYSYSGDTGGGGPTNRSITLSRALTDDDVGKQLLIETRIALAAAGRTTMGAGSGQTHARFDHHVTVTAELIAGSAVYFEDTVNINNAQVGWLGARGWMSAADTLVFAPRLNVSPTACQQVVKLIPTVEHLSVRGSASTSRGNIEGVVLTTGDINVTTGGTFPAATNIPRIEIPEDLDYLLIYAGRPTSSGSETGETFWLDIARLLQKSEAGYSTTTSSTNSVRFNDSIDTGADFYAGWVTDPNDSTKKLLLLTSASATDDFLGFKISKPVAEAISVSSGALKAVSELPELTADNFEWIWNLNGTLIQNVGVPLTTSTLAVTYSRPASGSTINLAGHANVRYRGAHYGSHAVANPQNNDIFLNLLGGQIWYYIHVAGDELQDGWHPATQALLNAMGYLGYRSSKSRADQLVAHASQSNKVGLYVGYGGYLRRVTAFTDETETHTVYHPQEYVPHTPVPGSIVVDDEEFFTTSEIVTSAVAAEQAREDPLIPAGGAGTLTERGEALGFAAAAATPFNLTYEKEANQPPVIGIMIRGFTGDADGGVPVVMWFGNPSEVTAGTFVAADVKVASGRYLRVRADMRQGSGDTIDIRTYGGDTPIAADVTLKYYAIIKVE